MSHNIPQSENLFLLVGTNPLPNYVAAKLLLKPGGHIYLFHTDETATVADRLIAALQAEKGRVTKIEVKEAQGEEIFNKIAEHVKGKQDVGLNYTGGTKTMAVHAYRAVEEYCQGAVFSYLDARTLSMVVDQGDQPSRLFPVGLQVQPTVETLLVLHGYTLKRPPATDVFGTEIAQTLARINCKNFRSWCDDNLRNGPDTPIRKKGLDDLSLPNFIDWQGARFLKDLATQWNREVIEVAKWLDGKWLEHYTLWSLQQIAKDCQIHETAMSITPKERNFEFDVVAMRGYQLFAISCTTETKRSLTKQKLFEVFVRARQMGGDEARIGLVCCAPKAEDNPDSNPTAIQKEIEESWDAAGKVRVFGAEHLPNLPDHLRDWFNSQPS
ncbi:MAG: DUF1887 family CARF protein [Desulfobacterota bacterium]|nr:DUF1887 family CARF protein [Thermodesulfobacteriota bacterium]